MAHAGGMESGLRSQAVVVAGPSGSGKSTVGRVLAERLGATFVDADDLHPAQNVAKMAAGDPLSDHDREPWLRRVADRIADEPDGIVVACSALRRAYRELLRMRAGRPLVFVQLRLAREALAGRLQAREGHFMPVALLDSQLATLEPLEPDEPGIVVDGTLAPAAICGEVVAWLARTAS